MSKYFYRVKIHFIKPVVGDDSLCQVDNLGVKVSRSALHKQWPFL